MDKSTFGFHPVPKPAHKRGKRKQGQETAITIKVDKEIYRRASEAGYTVCEHCGCSVPRFRFERCHMLNASQYGTGRAPWNVVILCGPRNDNGSCHHWADETVEGRDWKARKQAELYLYYTAGEGKSYWK
ncbi:hypothetical protein A8L34_22375 [Bacillus sp. FJAT-27264]|uniref:hypothetical protein n=1 Tax=Paenibacillus sp. (strain DSM 101736 / FJAT-27264) TaxID=1850362 RepID=UPI000807C6A3|nr:hypothetical protein [Bacillus sp. FJAT-27264]OBZ08902.1 hypothetical protein A8L34_22375 [Bacillus sp. FJAT-27264]